MLLTRDAEVVLYCLFGMGSLSSVTFARRHIIHPRALAAFEELASAGLIAPIDADVLPPGSKGWRGTYRTGNPWQDYAEPTTDESFPMTTE